MSESTRSEDESPAGVVRSRRWFGVVRVLLPAVVIAPLLVWIVFVAICYAGGRRNSPGCFAIPLMLGPLLPFGLIASPILVVRTIFNWHRYPRRRQYGHALLTILLVGSLAFVGWVIVLSPVCSPGAAFMRGFRRHVQSQADIQAIRAWLDGTDAQAAAEQSARGCFDGSQWPAPIARLGPRYASVLRDEGAGLTVRLSWVDRPFGHWGLAVGRGQMRVPPAGFEKHNEHCLPLDSGAYVWHRMK